MALPGPLPAVVAAAREKQATVSAAALGFYAFNVVVTLAVLIYAVFAVRGIEPRLADLLQALTGGRAAAFRRAFEQVGGDAAGRELALVLAGAIAVWSSLRLFRATERVFADVYEIRRERRLVTRLLDSVIALVTVTLTILVTSLVAVVFVFRTGGWLGGVLGAALVWLSVAVQLLPVFYRFSGADVGLREVLPGLALAATGWTVSAVGLRLYVATARSVALYGVVGAVLLVLTWLYVVGLSLVLGVVLNAVLAGRLVPDEDWYLAGTGSAR